MPHGLVALENIFDRQDIRKISIDQMKPGDYIEVNIGTENGTSKKERSDLINLVKRFRDVFAFT